MKRQWKLAGKLLLVLQSLFIYTIMLEAQSYPSYSGQTSGTYILNSDITLNSTVTLNGNLTIYVGSGSVQNNNSPYKEKGFHIKRGNFNGDMFYVRGTAANNIYTLTIIGSDTDTVYIDGGAVFNTPGDARDGITNSTTCFGECLEANQWGSIYLTKVVVENVATNKVDVYGTGGVAVSAISLQTGSPDNNSVTIPGFSMTDCIIRAIYSEADASAIMFRETRHRAKLLRTKVYKCFGSMGTIRSVGATRSMLEVDNCQIFSNKTRSNGAGFAWYAGGSTDAELTILGNTKIHDNVSGGNGGGLYLGSKVSITSADIYNNEAIKGGGIYLYTYTGFRPYSGHGIKFEMDANVSVHDNTAVNDGGGVYVDMYASRFLGFDPDDNPISVEDAKCAVTIKDGGRIYGNNAQNGGGLYVNDCLPYKFQNPQNGKWSNEYKREVIIEGGAIHDNVAYQESDSYYGGGYICAQKSWWIQLFCN